MEFHKPVLIGEVVESLQLSSGAVFLDGTLGSGGHAREFAKIIGPTGLLIAMDRDPEMLAVGRARLESEFAGTGPQMIFAARPYEEVSEVLQQAGRECRVDGGLLDLGINSLQLEKAERGFSFSREGPLDSRYNPQEGGRTVADLLNNSDERELSLWFRDYADERLGRQIARRVVSQRKAQPFTTTTQFAELVRDVYPPKDRFGRIHPATRAFQALRIVVNDEMGAVDRGVRACMDVLAPGGRLAALSFHSIEDRLVKKIFRAASDPRPDPKNPYSATTTEGIAFEQENRDAIQCSDEESEENPRARSAKLRVIRRKLEAAS